MITNTKMMFDVMKIGFASALCLVFITLKLTNNINWSWWWVTSPLWIDFIISVVVGVIENREREAEKKQMIEYKKGHPEKKSKFMQKLDEAMERSEKEREEALKQRKGL